MKKAQDTMTTKKNTGLDYEPNTNPGLPPRRGPGRPPKIHEPGAPMPSEILAMIRDSASKRMTDAGRACDEMAVSLLSTLPDEAKARLDAIAEARKWVAQADRCEQAAERQKLAEALAKQDTDTARRVAMAGLQ